MAWFFCRLSLLLLSCWGFSLWSKTLADSPTVDEFQHLSPSLVELYVGRHTTQRRGEEPTPSGIQFLGPSFLFSDSSRQRVHVRLFAENTTKAVHEAHVTANFRATGVSKTFREAAGHLPVAGLAALEAMGRRGLLYAVQPSTPRRRVSRRSSKKIRRGVHKPRHQADILHQLDRVREETSLDGTGITICVLSDSANANQSLTKSIQKGHLPKRVRLLSDSMTGKDEGTAMLELAYASAPGARYVIAYQGQCSLDTVKVIRELQSICHIIVDDFWDYGEPWFQDGIVARAVRDVSRLGVLYISAAGHERYYSTHVLNHKLGDDILCGNGSRAVQFRSGITRVPVTLRPGKRFLVILGWSQPIGRVTTNYDPILYDVQAGTTLPLDKLDERVTQKPQVIWHRKVSSASTSLDAEVVVCHRGGEEDVKHVQLVFNGIRRLPVQFGDTPFITPHAGVPEALAVASISFYDQNEEFVARGPAWTYYSPSGDPLPEADQRRLKPDVAAYDGSDTSFYGNIDIDRSGFPNFIGSSASAPIVAAFAALVWQSMPRQSNVDVANWIRATAEGGAPYPFYLAGAGVINPWWALVAIAPEPLPFVGTHAPAAWEAYNRGPAYIHFTSTPSVEMHSYLCRSFSSRAVLHVDALGYRQVILTFVLERIASNKETANFFCRYNAMFSKGSDNWEIIASDILTGSFSTNKSLPVTLDDNSMLVEFRFHHSCVYKPKRDQYDLLEDAIQNSASTPADHIIIESDTDRSPDVADLWQKGGKSDWCIPPQLTFHSIAITPAT